MGIATVLLLALTTFTASSLNRHHLRWLSTGRSPTSSMASSWPGEGKQGTSSPMTLPTPDAFDDVLVMHSLLQCEDDSLLLRCGVADPREPLAAVCSKKTLRLSQTLLPRLDDVAVADAPSCSHPSYRLTFGLIVKARGAITRVVKKQLLQPVTAEKLAPSSSSSSSEGCPITAARFLKLLLHVLCAEDRAILIDALAGPGPGPITSGMSAISLDGESTDRALLPLTGMTPLALYRLSYEVQCKTMNLSPSLQKSFGALPLRAQVADSIGERDNEFRLQMPSSFLAQVASFFATVQRPPGTFDAKESKSSADPLVGSQPSTDSDIANADASIAQTASPPRSTSVSTNFTYAHLLPKLLALPREACPECGHMRAIYCGPCGGARTPLAAALMPPRLALPFDVLLLLHPAESLRHCTGIHAGVMSERESVSTLMWPRTRDVPARLEQSGTWSSILHSTNASSSDPPDPRLVEHIQRWEALLDAIDPQRDIILFPADGAVLASDWDWSGQPPIGQTGNLSSTAPSDKTLPPRYRLIVLEASWNNSKAMYRLLQTGLAARGVSLPTVMLTDVVGTYWKFHYEGNAAVSTIEAIAHCVGEVKRSMHKRRQGIQRATTTILPGETLCTAAASRQDKEDEQEVVRQLHALLIPFEYDRCRVQLRVGEGGKAPRAVVVTGVGTGSWAAYLALPKV